jgi:uncharacterized repeat protein (TIGR03803 family)
MYPNHVPRSIFSLFASLLLSLSLASAAVSERVLHSFLGTPDGGNPSARLIADANGNLYGTGAIGGEFGDGCVFKLSASSNGTWTETILYSFSGSDGQAPDASLLFDSVGNLYGTTAAGGAYSGGVAFELSPSWSLPWSETILHNFGNGTDGSDPQAEMIFDAAGNLYGTTQFGGTGSGYQNGGTVFRLTPSASGWTETLLYSFPGSYSGPDGDLPGGSVVMDASGNLFGVAQAGGQYGKGAVYELSPNGDGTFNESIIHSFNISNGDLPNSTLVFDGAGHLYGTTLFGGNTTACPDEGCGTVFRLTKTASNTWASTVLRELNKTTDGWEMVGPVAFDSAGNLYAAAQAGGYKGSGTIFELSPRATAPWFERVVHYFANTPDGADPAAGVIVNSAGDLFGTTSGGGSAQFGTLFEITP